MDIIVFKRDYLFKSKNENYGKRICYLLFGTVASEQGFTKAMSVRAYV